ncbi:hypothetical protein [Streptomyces sp. NPDC003710]
MGGRRGDRAGGLRCVFGARAERRTVRGPLDGAVEQRVDTQLYDSGPGSALDLAREPRHAEPVRVGRFPFRFRGRLRRRACAGHRRAR